MRFIFNSDTRASRISKSVKKHLATYGKDLPLSQVREATAVMYGYRGWNDLLSQVGSEHPSPYDDELPAADISVRTQSYTQRLSEALGISSDLAHSVVMAVAPSGRANQSPQLPITSIIDERHIRSMAKFISQKYQNITPVTVSRFRGFHIEDMIIQGHIRNADLLVSDDGHEVFFGTSGSRPPNYSTPLVTDCFGNFMHEAGLARPAIQNSLDANPDVLSTLLRLDRRALEMLRGAPSFSSDTYRLCFSIPDDAPFRTLLNEYPMLATEIERAAHSVRMRYYDTSAIDIITSIDPLSSYSSHVLSYVAQEWPLVAKPSVDGINETTRSIMRTLVVHDKGIMPWHIAFLSLAPRGAIPESSDQLRSALTFIDSNTNIFRDDSFGIRPDMFYNEFRSRFGYDWRKLSAFSTRHEMHEVNVATEIGSTMINMAAFELQRLDRTPSAFDNPVSRIIGLRYLERATGNLGYYAATEKIKSFRSSTDGLTYGTPDYTVAAWKSLFDSGFLSAEFRHLTATEIVNSVGVEAAEAIFMNPEQKRQVPLTN